MRAEVLICGGAPPANWTHSEARDAQRLGESGHGWRDGLGACVARSMPSLSDRGSMPIEDFKGMYLAELQALYSVERQLAAALPGMAWNAANAELKTALTTQVMETGAHMERLVTILRSHDVEPQEHTDQAMRTLIDEMERWQSALPSPALKDAGLIASVQRIRHYGIGVYGTVTTYASTLGFQQDKATLHTMLEEEKAADQRLTEIAKSLVNQDAALT
jgi:ferritin-like metal-binding protein YciE